MTDELLIKVLLKESTIEENEKVEKWLNAAEANKKHFLQLETIWNVSNTLKNENKRDEEQAWASFKTRRADLKPGGDNIKPLNLGKIWLRIAAVLFIAVGGWVAYSLYSSGNYTELAATNQVRTETLPDGSALTLNKNSKISYAANFKNNRKLKLEQGDVFFDVAKDKIHPFVIDIEKISVEVVGTSFNIKHIKKDTEINVETGIVKVRLANNEIKLYKGEKIHIDGNTSKLVKEQSTDQLYNYYRSNLFQANNIALSKLVITLNEAYGSNITLDEKIKGLTINTTLKMGSINQNLEIICQTFNLQLSRNGNSILLSAKK
ncbi:MULTISPECIES: FecR family protein [unclassified Pedobacter]|uniref:FecR family protein n=1 Tax=unclassified Pedobacter TaxID=2628915 RepID=UPI00141E59E3|nr:MULTISPECIES: FecR family protein [unclassified Pedobacter]NII80972.1 ferric-dicitrate binding protein FerR (iron transport regulator) [Pedobacter sp. SG908]NMN34986.1 ferric-dicitrate binding protein FerR (iron transport regulator) [Pedobacter sp. SG918]